MSHYVLVGAGVAGLTVAHQLATKGHPVSVIERDAVAGGLARSWHYGDFHFDVGPGKTIEIRVGFTTGGKPNSTYGREWGSAGAQEAGLDILLGLLQTVAQASHGMLSLEPDPAKARKSFILKFPVERRKGSALIEEMP